MRDVLKFELSVFPLSLATSEGNLYKTVKSKLFQTLQDKIERRHARLATSPNIFDGMVLLQKTPPTLQTFGDLFDYLLQKLIARQSRVAYFFTDQYFQQSIKPLERKRRSSNGSLRIAIKRRDQKLPKQLKKFLRCSENKVDFIDFLLKDWSSPNPAHTSTLQDKEIYLTVRDKAFCITSQNGVIDVREVEELTSKQEEADTKMFLYAQHAASLGFSSANIITVDSDVAILCLYYQSRINLSLVPEYGIGTKTSVFDIESNTLDDDLKDALPGLNAFTGCDSTSCFSGQGKVKCLKLLRSDERFIDAAKLPGKSTELPLTVKDVFEEFVCRLYGIDKETDVNLARYKLFCKSQKVPYPQR